MKDEKEKKDVKNCKRVLLIVLFIILFVYVVMLTNNIINKDSTSKFLIWKFYNMAYEEKEYDLKDGDLVIIKEEKIEKIKEGDVVLLCYGETRYLETIKTIKIEGDDISISVQSDEDSQNKDIKNAEYQGKYVKKVAGLGSFSSFVQTPLGVVLLMSIFICLIILISVIVKKGYTEENTNQKDEGDTNEKGKSE